MHRGGAERAGPWLRGFVVLAGLLALAGCGSGSSNHGGSSLVRSADASTAAAPAPMTTAPTTIAPTDSATILALPEPPGGPRARARVTALPGGAALVTGGLGPGSGGSVALAQVLYYDPAHSQFVELAPLAHARCGHEATLLPSPAGAPPAVLVTGGCDGERLLDSVELIRIIAATSPDGRVSSETVSLPSLPSARSDHRGVVIAAGPNPGVLITGGVTDQLTATSLAVLYRVDATEQGVVSGHSVIIEQPRFARSEHSVIVLPGPDGVLGTEDDRVLVYGGVGGDSTTASDGSLVSVLAAPEVYEPWRDRWSTVRGKGAIPASAARPRHGHRCAPTTGGGALILGGEDSKEGILETLEIQLDAEDAGVATFSEGAALSRTRRDPEVAALDSGKILLAGGYDTASNQVLADADLFSADGRTRDSSFSLGGARAQHALANLGASVLLVGGIGETRTYGAPTAALLLLGR